MATKLTKAEQLKVNEIVKDDCISKLDYFTRNEPIRTYNLRSMSAKVLEYYSYYVLKSYDTIIAIITKSNHICYDFLRYVYGYTATSAKHVNAFAKDYHAELTLTYKEV